jgi:hypothetical protein
MDGYNVDSKTARLEVLEQAAWNQKENETAALATLKISCQQITWMMRTKLGQMAGSDDGDDDDDDNESPASKKKES